MNTNKIDLNRLELIKNYLKRLNEGEKLETVQAEFIQNFKDVEALEIMQAEQELINEGVPLEELQKLCDVHSALFHGSTKEEKIANAEKEVTTSIKRAQELNPDFDKKEIAQKLEAIPGHPLNIFHLENQEIMKILQKIKKEDLSDKEIKNLLIELKPVITHYAKKGDLLYPHLKVNYGVTGPSNVMWTVDDEIRDDLNKLIKEEITDNWNDLAQAVLKRIDEMIFKEENILFPAAALMFNEQDWNQIKQDQSDYPSCFGVENLSIKSNSMDISVNDTGEISLPGGSLNKEELEAILKTIPLEITFIDKNDINKYFNEGPKAFKRPLIALGHDVYSCHPPKVEKAVRKIINDFKNKKRDKVTMWAKKGDKPFMVTYIAVRDKNDEFLGTLELVQEMDDIEEHYLKLEN